jgi:hypothetical protein
VPYLRCPSRISPPEIEVLLEGDGIVRIEDALPLQLRERLDLLLHHLDE